MPGAGTGEGPEHVSAGAGAAFREAAARVCADIRAELGGSAAELAFFDSGGAFQGEQARSILAFSSQGAGQSTGAEVGAGNEAGAGASERGAETGGDGWAGGGDSAGFYEFLRGELARVEVPEDFPRELTGGFALGWVGAFGYELKGLSEDVRDSATALSTPLRHPSHPDAALIFADRGLVFSPADGAVIALALEPGARVGAGEEPNVQPGARAERWFARLAQRYGDGLEALFASAAHSPATHLPAPHANTTPMEFRLDHGREAYLSNVAACQERIAAGDSYELCLTTTARGPALKNPWDAYQRLREISPVPYGAYLQFGGRGLSLLSASPERFLKVYRPSTHRTGTPAASLPYTGENLVVEAKPIKGTRPRGAGSEDARWRRELENSEKDRAENLMIVDLLRNDLAKICEPGSVRVPRLFAVESYSHVHQLVSTITGELQPTTDAVAALAACFPGGSMTGAPKVRSMELLEALENSARGLYSGAIGWLSPTGEADLSITIRTLVDDRHGSSFGVGGAIVADSDPEAEWQEILVKASALLEALGAQIA